MIHKDSRSPWGKIQHVEYITPWLTSVCTASHGGYKVDRSHNSAIPAYMRKEGGWYEEDCDWSIVYVALESLIKKDCFSFSKERVDHLLKHAIDTFKNWKYKEYEMFFNVELKQGESYLKDYDIFDKEKISA